jgi:plasmid rolling circle replication initiator protein Rep
MNIIDSETTKVNSLSEESQAAKTRNLAETPPTPFEWWHEHKILAGKIAIHLSNLGDAKFEGDRKYSRRAERMAQCANGIQAKSCPDGHHHKITRAQLCRDRACPVCAGRRSLALAARTRQAMERAGGRFLLLTLTVKSPPDGELKKTVKHISTNFGAMMRDGRLRGVVGGYIRTLETTRSAAGWHPHIHALLRVDDGYFNRTNGLYIEQQEWCDLWRQYARLDYNPVVDVRAVHEAQSAGAAAEVSKYVTKGADILKYSLPELQEWLEAVKGVRLWSAGGCLKINDKAVENEMINNVDSVETPDVCPVCGKRLVLQDYWHTSRGYMPSPVPLSWPKRGETRAGASGRRRSAAKLSKG